jgi:hypothetical protein
VPGDLTFTIGESKESESWFYAQTEKGTLHVCFDGVREGSVRVGEPDGE